MQQRLRVLEVRMEVVYIDWVVHSMTTIGRVRFRVGEVEETSDTSMGRWCCPVCHRRIRGTPLLPTRMAEARTGRP